MKSIDKRIIKTRGDITQKDFAKKIGVSERTVCNYETGLRKPDYDVLNRIVEVFSVDPAWLITGIASLSNNDLIAVPQLDVAFSAGCGTYAEDHPLYVGSRAFNRKWLRKKGLEPKNLALTRIVGDSWNQ